MRLEIRYPDKPSHEVELKGTMTVLGRDPSCDLVIADERCSRRHAALEVTPTGLQVRDMGSANGVFVNGKKAERSWLVAGDLVRLGEVILKVLPEEPSGTVVAGIGEIAELGPPPANSSVASGPSTLGTEERPRPGEPARAPRPRAGRPPSGPLSPAAPGPGSPAARARLSGPSGAGTEPVSENVAAAAARARSRAASGLPSDSAVALAGRPATVTLLAALWLVSIFIYAAQAILSLMVGLGGVAGATTIVLSSALAVVSGLMAWGLFALKPWARLAQAVIAGVGLLVCPFTLASATTLIYVLRPSTRAAFDPDAKAPIDPAEMTFALTLIGTVVLGAGLCAAAFLANRFLA